MKTCYYMSVDLHNAGIIADSEEEAYKIANRLIREKAYSLQICDREEVKD